MQENQRIRETCESQTGSAKEIPGKLEKLLDVSRNQAEKLGFIKE